MRGATYVFVGCGGTFWCGTPYLSNLMRRYKPIEVHMVDPDVLLEGNLDRQWTNRASAVLSCLEDHIDCWKVDIAGEAFDYGGAIEDHTSKFEDWTAKDGLEGPVVVVVNVDSNRSRLAIREWCRDRGTKELTAMVVSGCDGGGGQAYWGVWGTPPHLRDHDWLPLHKDVETEPDLVVRREHGCGGQTTFANALTGQLLGMSIENLTQYVETTPSDIQEYWWEINPAGRYRSWSLLVMPTGPAKGEVRHDD